MTGKEKGMDLRKRWLAILTTMCMLASLAPTGVFAAGSAASQAAAAENSAVSPVSAETYSDLGLSRDVSGEKLVSQKQPYGNDVTGSVVATNESSPDSCVKCYTMFLPFLLIKIDVFS